MARGPEFVERVAEMGMAMLACDVVATIADQQSLPG
jgi:hypothetical protein